MAYVTLEDDTGALEVICFSRCLNQYGAYIQEGQIVAITGQLSLRDDKDIPRAETMAFQFKDVGVKEWRMVCVPGCHPFDGGGKTEENQAICAEAGAWVAGV